MMISILNFIKQNNVSPKYDFISLRGVDRYYNLTIAGQIANQNWSFVQIICSYEPIN